MSVISYRTCMSETVALAIDEDGFFALVSPDLYRGFVAEDWELDQLMSHFLDELNSGSLFIAYPGPDDADEPVLFNKDSSAATPLREAVGTVEVSAAGLWLTDYTQLTMAAQFRDESSIALSATLLPVPEGLHTVVFQQVDMGYRLTVMPVSQVYIEMPDAPRQLLDAVPWFH